MRTGIVIVGLILLFVGGFTAFLFYYPWGSNNSPWDVNSMDEVAENYDSYDGNFRSYDKGDRLIIEGKITNEGVDEFDGSSIYSYELDNEEKMGIISGEDLGDKGDEICVEVEVVTMDFGFLGESAEFLEVKEILSSPPPLFYIGLVAGILGLLFLIIGLVASGSKEAPRPSIIMMPQQQQQQQQQSSTTIVMQAPPPQPVPQPMNINVSPTMTQQAPQYPQPQYQQQPSQPQYQQQPPQPQYQQQPPQPQYQQQQPQQPPQYPPAQY